MKILITGAIEWTEKQKNEVKSLEHEIVYIQDERIPLTGQNVNVSDIEGVICNGLFLYNDITSFTNLKYIQLTSAGYDRVPMDYVREHGIRIFNARGVYSIPIAEFAISGVLQLYKQSRYFYENQKLQQWVKHREIIELLGKTVCIVGCGSVGTECAKRFQVFGCKVIGVDICPREDMNYDRIARLEQLEMILSQSDVVVLTLPLTEATRYLMNKERLRQMKQGAVLVNIARGAVIDNGALIDELQQKNLMGAVLDVFEKEPLASDSVLWRMENVIITPHNSFVGEGNRGRLQKVILKNLEKEK